MLQCCSDKSRKDRVWMIRSGLKFWMELSTYVKWVVADFYDFDESVGLGNSTYLKASCFNLLTISSVEFIAVTVSFADRVFSVEFVGYGIWQNL